MPLPSKEKKVKASKAKLAKRPSGAESRHDLKKFSGRSQSGCCCFGVRTKPEEQEKKKKKTLKEINEQEAEYRAARAEAAADVERQQAEIRESQQVVSLEQTRRNSNASLLGQNKEGEPIENVKTADLD